MRCHLTDQRADRIGRFVPCRSTAFFQNQRGRCWRKNRSQLPWKMPSIASEDSRAGQDCVEFLQVRDAIEPGGRLLGAEAAVQVAADGRVVRIAGELADVVDVVGHGFETDDLARGLAPTQPGASIQASRAAPMTAPRSINRLICSSLNCR